MVQTECTNHRWVEVAATNSTSPNISIYFQCGNCGRIKNESALPIEDASCPSTDKELTPMQKLIDWIDSEIIINPYYRASPRLFEGAMIVKCKAIELLEAERKMAIDMYNEGEDTYDIHKRTAEQYFNHKYKQL